MLKHLIKSSFNHYNKFLTLNKCNVCSCATLIKRKTISRDNLKCSYVPHRNININGKKQAKLFVDIENNFIFTLLKDNSCSTNLLNNTSDFSIESAKDFEELLNKNWRTSNAVDILKAFKSVQQYCINNSIDLANPQFDGLVNGLMDHCEKLTDDELLELLICLREFPVCESYNCHNFHDIWSCLDDICCWKLHNWDVEKMFKFADAWYMLKLGKICDFISQVMSKLPKKADKLTKDQLVRAFFYYNVIRNRPVDFEFEYALAQKIDEMSSDEAAVVALGYFKTKTKIKLSPIMNSMINKVITDSKSIHEISLTAILKILRYSGPGKLYKEINIMLDSVHAEMDRLSNLCCLHVALLGTGLQMLHKSTLVKASQRIIKDITNPEVVRLKDIERILNSLTMFDFDPQTKPDIFKAALSELHKESRLMEFSKYPRCLPSTLNYLSMKNIYSYELMDKVLNIDFIIETYGKTAKLVPRELFLLDSSIDIDCPDYTGNRLSPKIKYRAVKWLTEFVPSYTQYKRITATDKLVLNTIDQVKLLVKDEKLIYIDHVLPHFSRADIILCKDKNTGKFVEPQGFEKYVFGDVKFANVNENLHWIAIVILGWNNTFRDSSLPLGNIIMKQRQLKKIGYQPVLVIWNEFLNLSDEGKFHYISNKLL